MMIKRSYFRALCVASVMVVIPVLATPSSASPAMAQAGDCTVQQRHEALAEDQSLVLQQVGSLSTLRNPADVALLAQRGWAILPHQWTSFRGMGVGIVHTASAGVLVPGSQAPHHLTAPQSGLPTLLLYRPGPTTANATDPYGLDFPYELVGWAYAAPYDYDHHPTTAGRCYTRSDWFVHERGIHDFETWGFIPVPPTENFHGQDPGNQPFVPAPPGLPHSRLWDLHVWLNRLTGVPDVSIVDPHEFIPGIDPRVGSFFYYPEAPPASATGGR